MSVMQRNSYGGTATGQPLDYQSDPAALQRQAVVNQLAPPASAATQPGQSFSSFNRGGQTTQLPGMGADTTNKLVSTGAGIAATAAGSMNPVSIGTDYLGKKLKPKEEMPTFGGEFGDLTDQYGRRFEGAGPGIKGGAVRGAGYGAFAGPVGAGIGAAAGAIIGAATRNATSAYSDFSSQDAADAVGRAYQQYLGRPASEQEIRDQLVGQGWNPTGGDRWVGEKGLFSVLGSIKNSPEAQAYAARGGQPSAAQTSTQGQPGALQPMARTAGPSDGVTELSPGAAQQLLAYNQGQDQRRAAVAGETDALRARGWDGKPETRGSDVMGQQETERQALLSQLGIPAEVTGVSGPVASANPGAPFRLPGTVADGINPDGSGGISGRGAGDIVPANADTDGYAAPQFTAQGSAQAPPGWDQTKWADTAHQTPKYAVGHILSQFPPTVDGLKQAADQVAKAYPGTTFDGKDKLTIPGVGTIDVLVGASQGGSSWAWQPTDGGGAQGGGGTASTPAVDASRGYGTQPDVLDSDTIAQLKQRLAEIIAGTPNRDAIVNGLGASNG